MPRARNTLLCLEATPYYHCVSRCVRRAFLCGEDSHSEALTQAESKALAEVIATWRQRLMSISWFMRCLNEPIARAANREDDISGRFWEGRFKSQALLDEKALAACMAYVDLNPIRAMLAHSPETSAHTSIKRSIEYARATQRPNHLDPQSNGLLPFAGNPRNDMPKGLPFHLSDYLELVDCSGRIMREDKKGQISDDLPAILQRLELDMDTRHWLYLTQHFEHPFRHLVGAAHHVRSACEALGQRWVQGISQCERLFSSG